jgi:hypothetical protein
LQIACQGEKWNAPFLLQQFRQSCLQQQQQQQQQHQQQQHTAQGQMTGFNDWKSFLLCLVST